jgi:hypothetical protein
MSELTRHRQAAPKLARYFVDCDQTGSRHISAAIPHYARTLDAFVRLEVQPSELALWKTEPGMAQKSLDPESRTVYRAYGANIYEM